MTVAVGGSLAKAGAEADTSCREGKAGTSTLDGAPVRAGKEVVEEVTTEGPLLRRPLHEAAS